MGAFQVKYDLNSQRINNDLTFLKYEHKNTTCARIWTESKLNLKFDCCQVEPLPQTVRIPSCTLAVSSRANGQTHDCCFRVFFLFLEFSIRRWKQWKQHLCPWMHHSVSPVLLSTKPSDHFKILWNCRPPALFGPVSTFPYVSPDVCSAVFL